MNFWILTLALMDYAFAGLNTYYAVQGGHPGNAGAAVFCFGCGLLVTTIGKGER